MTDTVESIMALADEAANCYFAEDSGSDWAAARANLRAAVERVVQERDEARESDGWKWTESARKDRAAAVSQWKAAKERAERDEAERDALKVDAARYRWLRKQNDLDDADEIDARIDAAMEQK